MVWITDSYFINLFWENKEITRITAIRVSTAGIYFFPTIHHAASCTRPFYPKCQGRLTAQWTPEPSRGPAAIVSIPPSHRTAVRFAQGVPAPPGYSGTPGPSTCWLQMPPHSLCSWPAGQQKRGVQKVPHSELFFTCPHILLVRITHGAHPDPELSGHICLETSLLSQKRWHLAPHW